MGYDAPHLEGKFPGPESVPPSHANALPSLNEQDRQVLLALAHRAIASSVHGFGEPEVDAAQMPPFAALPWGCFVTVRVEGELRGCIGSVLPRLPLYRAVSRHAIQAACEDRRFAPIRCDELEVLHVEISVLSVPGKLPASTPKEVLLHLRPGLDGVLLVHGQRSATYLPQVWKNITEPREFMESLSRKAGLGPDAWRDPEATISLYEVLAFGDAEEQL